MNPHATQTGQDMLKTAAPGAFPIGVTGASLFGFTLQEWVYVFTIVYTILLILKLVRGFFIDRRERLMDNG